MAAIIQGIAALVFLFSVGWDARERRNERRRRVRLAEQERRDGLVHALYQLWVHSTPINKTNEEISGLLTTRIIEFINQQLEARGETWKYPFEREE